LYVKNIPWVNGAEVTATVLDNWEDAIFAAFYQSQTLPLEAGIITHSYAGDNVTRSDLTVSAVLRVRIEYTYTGDDLTGQTMTIYDTDGTTILSQVADTFAYTGDNLTSETRAVIV